MAYPIWTSIPGGSLDQDKVNILQDPAAKLCCNTRSSSPVCKIHVSSKNHAHASSHGNFSGTSSEKLPHLFFQTLFHSFHRGTINSNHYTARGKLCYFVLTQSDAIYHSIFLIPTWLFCILTHIFALDIWYVSFLPNPKGGSILPCV